MDDERRASWVRRLVMLVFIGCGLAAGWFIDLPGWSDRAEQPKEESKLEQVDEENFREIIAVENRLTVMNMMIDGQPDAEKLREILEQLQQENTYGRQVAYTELDIVRNQAMGETLGADFEEFAGQLDFYAAGYKLGTLEGPADRARVEETIERYLAGLVKRFGPGWLPEVGGMRRADNETPVLNVLPADPVPGLTPANRRETANPGALR